MFENVTEGRQTDRRRTDGWTRDTGVIGILIAQLGAFGSGELKHYHYKNKSPLFFHAVYLSQNNVMWFHVIPHLVIAAILDVTLNIYNAENNNMPVKFSKYNRF